MRRADDSQSCGRVDRMAPRLLAAWWPSRALAAASPPTESSSNLVSLLTLLCGLGGLIVGVYLFFRGFQLLKRKRWIEDTPISKVAGAAIGQVKVLGRATGPYTLLSPLAGVDCYYYRAIARSGARAENEERRESRAVESIFTPFFVEDETGKLMVDPRGAELDLPQEYDETVSIASMSECARRFLQRHGLSAQSETIVSEYAIKPGDPLLVLGRLGEAHSPSTYLSAEAADLQRREQLEAMGVPPGEMPEWRSDSAEGFDLLPPVLLTNSEDGEPLILSRELPKGMIDGLARQATFNIWVGPPLALFGLWLCLKWLGLP